MERINLAAGAPVNAVGGNREAITDGNTQHNSYWDGGKAPAAALIDLGSPCKVKGIHVVTYYGDGRYYHYTVSASSDGTVFETIAEKNDDTPATADGESFKVSVKARWIKINMTYNSDNPSVHLCECEVFGTRLNKTTARKPKFDQSDVDNIAFGKKVRTNANTAFAHLITDGNDDMAWIGEDYPKYADIDLGAVYELSDVVVSVPQNYGEKWIVFGSNDGVMYDRLADGENSEKVALCGCYRIVRVLVTSVSEGAGASSMISEVRVHGTKTKKRAKAIREKLSFVPYDEWLAKNPAKTVYEELGGLIGRTIGKKYVDKFVFEIADGKDGKDYFELSSDGVKVKVKGNNGVSCAAGVGHYFKYYCNVLVSEQTRHTRMPAKLPATDGTVCVESPYSVRYAYNYCTHAYTMPYFGVDEWQKELDWLMLSGVNLILDITGSEALWVHYLQKLGYTVDEAKDHVCGYCYKPWWLMGNLEGYGGSVADAWVYDTLELARRNQRYMHTMGAMPCQQTFVGAMPMSFGRIANNSLVSLGYSPLEKYIAPQGTWGGGFVRPNVLKTDYDGYSYLAAEYYSSQRYLFGDLTHYYCGDVCHEGGIIPEGLTKPEMSQKIMAELLSYDPSAQWILQGWWDNPMPEVLDGLGEHRKNNVIILDLASVANPKWNNTEKWGGIEYGGTGWVYCDLNNYGGRTGMHGDLYGMTARMDEARSKAQYMRGIGVTPEGSYQNPVVFDLFFESAWGDKKNVDEWIGNYVSARYGKRTRGAMKAWRLMCKSVYGKASYDGTTKNNVINENASLAEKYCSGPYYRIPYDRKKLEAAAVALAADFGKLWRCEGYIYDLSDLLRQTLTNAADDYFVDLVKALKERDTDTFNCLKVKFIDCMKLVSKLSTYVSDETMKKWLGRIYEWAKRPYNGKYSDYDIYMMEVNAKGLLTTWASRPITNYANRQFTGLMEDYFIEMWQRLFDRVSEELAAGKEEIDPALGRGVCFDIGWNFAVNEKDYSDTEMPRPETLIDLMPAVSAHFLK